MGFWADYRPIGNNWGDIGAQAGGFFEAISNLANALFGLIKILYLFALAFSIIAFVYSIIMMVVHSSDTPYLKDQAKHDMLAALISIAILGSLGFVYSLILALLF